MNDRNGRNRVEDRICIRDLELDCIIGVNPEERTHKQRIVVDIELEADLAKPGATDSLEDTVNYSDLAKEIIDFAGGSSYLLIEKLAEEIAKICLRREKAAAVTVVVKKPGAVSQGAYAAVEIYRRNKHG